MDVNGYSVSMNASFLFNHKLKVHRYKYLISSMEANHFHFQLDIVNYAFSAESASIRHPS